MKASKLMDSLNYLDDDLIRESDNAFAASDIPKKKAKVSALISVLSVAASIVLIFAIINIVSDSLARSKSASDKVSTHNNVIGEYNEIPAVNERDEVREENAAADEYDSGDSAEEAVTTDAAEIPEEGVEVEIETHFISYLDQTYISNDETVDEALLGDAIGMVNDSDIDEYIGATIYSYGDSNVAIEFEGEYIQFEPADN